MTKKKVEEIKPMMVLSQRQARRLLVRPLEETFPELSNEQIGFTISTTDWFLSNIHTPLKTKVL